MNAKRKEYMVGVLVMGIPLCPHSINVSPAQTMFFEEEDYRREGRVPSSRTRFQKLLRVEERTKVSKKIRERFRKFFYKKIISISHCLEGN